MAKINPELLNSPVLKTEIVNSNLKVFMLTWEYPPFVIGGLATHTYGLATALAKNNCEVHIVTAKHHDLATYELVDGVHIHRVKPLNEQDASFVDWIGGLNLALVNKVFELLKDSRYPNIIHVHDWLVGSAGLIIKETLQIPLLTTIHATESGRNNGIYTELQRFIHEKEAQLIKESDQIIVCSEFMKEEVFNLFEVANKKISVIANGIEPKTPTKGKQTFPFPINKDKKMVFSLGRMVKEKGFETIIDAALLAKQKNLPLYFVIAGKGPMLDVYRQNVLEQGLENDVFLPGFVSEKQREFFFENSDIAVFPSVYEPFGIVALEAMAHEKPTIVSNTGGLKGIIKHLRTGILVEPANADKLFSYIVYLLENPEKASDMAKKGREIVESLYCWKRIADETKRVMEDTVVLRKIGADETELKK